MATGKWIPQSGCTNQKKLSSFILQWTDIHTHHAFAKERCKTH